MLLGLYGQKCSVSSGAWKRACWISEAWIMVIQTTEEMSRSTSDGMQARRRLAARPARLEATAVALSGKWPSVAHSVLRNSEHLWHVYDISILRSVHCAGVFCATQLGDDEWFGCDVNGRRSNVHCQHSA